MNRLVRDMRKGYKDFSTWFSDFSDWCKAKRFTIRNYGEDLNVNTWWLGIDFCCYGYTVLVDMDRKGKLGFIIE